MPLPVIEMIKPPGNPAHDQDALSWNPYLAPEYITGPKTLVAVLDFYPVIEKVVRTKAQKKKYAETPPKRPLKDFRIASPIPQWNDFLKLTNQVIHAVRRSAWLAGKPEENIEAWRAHGKAVAEDYLHRNKLQPFLLEYAEIVIVCFNSDEIKRDINGLNPKAVIDGISSVGYFKDCEDARVIEYSIKKGALTLENPRYEMWIYNVALSEEAKLAITKLPEPPKPIKFPKSKPLKVAA
jgi:hypothetical protein